MRPAVRPYTLTLAALGGQGGAVVVDWLTAVARAEKHLVQATSVPGVAQRTGATLYYLEFFAESALPPDGRVPVMALMPSPGDVDVVVATELIEAGRAIQRGLVTTDRTTLIASTHRVYTIAEKSALGDGRADSAAVLAVARAAAKRCVALDMQALADAHGAVISAVAVGTIAAAAGLPFAADSYRTAIRTSGIAVERNLAAFEASFASAHAAAAGAEPEAGFAPAPAEAQARRSAIPETLRRDIERDFARPAWDTLTYGVARLIDYQDVRYAAEYLARLAPIAAAESGATAHSVGDARLTIAAAKGLALWMSIEDTIRVAELKLRPERLAGIRRDLKARPEQIVDVREFLKPRVEEICGTLPAGLGRRLLGSSFGRRMVSRFTGARTVCTTGIRGYLLLRTVASLKRWRRRTLRFAWEEAHIAEWLEAVTRAAGQNYELGVEAAQAQQLVRGYGDTYERGLCNFRTLLAATARLAGRVDAAQQLARLRQAAQADEQGTALARELAALGVVDNS